MKIWAKLLDEDKIFADTVYSDGSAKTYSAFCASVAEVCKILDCSTPILLPLHYSLFREFNIVRFKPDDFVDALGHSMLVIEQF